ncbi:S8 family serine peptidase [Streptococcus hillyeri]|uniref:S8 family serine peptidase n=1 Tax=Streptococcus hillyeri TaxID=2282420 RepID=UPI0034E1A0B3
MTSEQKLDDPELDDEEFDDTELDKEKPTETFGPKRYILQFEDGKKDTILKDLEAIKGLTVKYTYDQLFQGAAVELPESELEKLKKTSGIKTIQESTSYKTSKPRQSEAPLASLMTSPQFKQLHKDLDGRGLVIATIDSGIDLTHPDLRLDITDPDVLNQMKIKDITPNGQFNHKVPHGFNYMRGDTDMIDQAKSPHGMHIAGILAGNSLEPKGFKGIAPNAQLLTYKVFSENYGNTDEYEYVGDNAVFHAMEDAVKRGADVISLSVGERGTGHPDDIFYKAVKKATEAGVIVVAAMGNYGAAPSTNTYDKYTDNSLNTKDLSTTVSVAANPLAIGVGSAQSPIVYLPTLTIGGKNYAYSDLSKHNEKTLSNASASLVYIDQTREDKNHAPLYNKIALVHRGGESVFDKVKKWIGKGAKGVIVINNPTEYSRGNFETHPIIGYHNLDIPNKWAISVSHKDGQELIALAAQQLEQKLTFNKEAVPHQLLNAPRVSGFTSWGANLNLEIKPDLVAPGEDVYSLGNHGKYVMLSGTSMASPYVAGVSALLSQHAKSLLAKSSEKDLSLVELTKLLLMNTAKPLQEQEEANGGRTSLYHSPRQQGAGLTQFEEALKSTVIVTHDNKGAASLKEIGDTKSFKLTFRNLGNTKQSFTLKHGTVQGVTNSERIRLDESGEIAIQAIFPKAIEGASLEHPETVTIDPNSSVTIDVVLKTGQAKDEFVEGYLEFISADKNHPNLSMPYMGFKGEWHKEAIADAPAWEKESKTKLSLLLHPKYKTHDEFEYITIGKEDGKETPNPELYALTTKPRDVNAVSKVAPRYIFLREAQDYEVAIVDRNDDQAKVLQVLQTGHFANKYGSSIYKEYEHYRKHYDTPANENIWEGKLYNRKTGEDEAAPEGQYYYRLRARLTSDSPYQTMYIPIKVDSTRPTYDVTYDTNTNKLTIIPSDNHAIKTVKAKLSYRETPVTKLENHRYEIDLADKDEDRDLSIEVFDQAGNSTEHRLTVANWKKLTGILHIVDNDSEDTEEDEEVITSPRFRNKFNLSTSRSSRLTKQSRDEEADEDDLEDLDDMSEEDIENDDTSEIEEDRQVDKDIDDEDDDEESYDEEFNDDDSGEENSGDDEYEDEESDDEETNDVDEDSKTPSDDDDTFTVSNIPMHNVLKYTYFDIIEDKHNNFASVDKGNILYKVPIFLRQSLRAVITNTNVHYNRNQQIADAYKPFSTVEYRSDSDSDGWTLENLNLPITDGSNQINIKVYQTIDGKEELIFNKGYFLYLDTEKPALALDTSHITFFKEKDDKEVNGTITAQNSKVIITGNIQDNLDGWKLYINNNMIDSRILTGEYGDNGQVFHYELDIEDNDIIKVHALDYLGNEIEYKFYAKVVTEEVPNDNKVPEEIKEYSEQPKNSLDDNQKNHSENDKSHTKAEHQHPHINNLKLEIPLEQEDMSEPNPTNQILQNPIKVDNYKTQISQQTPSAPVSPAETNLPQTGEKNLGLLQLPILGVILSSLATYLGIKRKQD